MVWNSWEPSRANKEPAPQFLGSTGVVGVRGTVTAVCIAPSPPRGKAVVETVRSEGEHT